MTLVHNKMTGDDGWRRALWCRAVIVAADGQVIDACVLEGAGPPDLAAVDALARFALQAARLGARVVLEEVSAPMGDLLELAGLRLQRRDGLEPGRLVRGAAEMRGQSEGGEQALEVDEGEEVVDRGDLPA